MPFPLAALLLSAQVVLAAADKVPSFDARPGCNAGADAGITTKPDIEGCVRSEMEARDTLVKEWDDFAVADRTRCVEKTQMGGPPSYIEVLTCLEIARDVRRLTRNRRDDNLGLSKPPSR
ncbi:MAG: hypothetical protein IT538_01665 [Variibacter sp.]|nr:hypothetical protein [Variibacter sp.]